jgi:hypothetical protein
VTPRSAMSDGIAAPVTSAAAMRPIAGEVMIP